MLHFPPKYGKIPRFDFGRLQVVEGFAVFGCREKSGLGGEALTGRLSLFRGQPLW